MEDTCFVNLWGEITSCCEAFSDYAFQMEIDSDLDMLPLLPRMETYLEEFEDLPPIPPALITCEEQPTEEQVERRELTDHTAVVFSC